MLMIFLLSIGRHGQGWHNLGTEFYGDKWDEWRTKTGDDRVTWGPDAELTPKGRMEALVRTHNDVRQR
jgi:hypothetical protein